MEPVYIGGLEVTEQGMCRAIVLRSGYNDPLGFLPLNEKIELALINGLIQTRSLRLMGEMVHLYKRLIGEGRLAISAYRLIIRASFLVLSALLAFGTSDVATALASSDSRLSTSSAEEMHPGSSERDARRSGKRSDVAPLSARDLELILEFGTAGDRKRLWEQIRSSSDAALFETLISWYLNREEYDTANLWIQVADTKGIPVAPWQRMSLALHSDDRETIERLLRESANELPAATRVEALSYLGRRKEAIYLGRIEIGRITADKEFEQLNDLLKSLDRSENRSMAIKGSSLVFGPLQISGVQAASEFPIEAGSLLFAYKDDNLDSSDTDSLTLGDIDHEYDLSMSFEPAPELSGLSFRIGGNFRRDDSIAYGKVDYRRKLATTPLTDMTLSLAVNQLSYDTAFLRAFGTKSHVSLGATGAVSRWDYFFIGMEGHRHQTRDGEELAHGYKVEASWGRILSHEIPKWDVSLRGALEKNTLADSIPSSLLTTGVSIGESENIVTSEYEFLGLATSISHENPGEKEKTIALEFKADAYAGWQWPTQEPSFGVSLSVERTFFSRHSLDFMALYASSLNGGVDQSYSELSLSYRYRF